VSTTRWALAALLVALCVGGCQRAQPEARDPDRAPALDAFNEDLRSAALWQLEDALSALEGRDDLHAIDQRRAIDLAWRNRSPAELTLEPGQGPTPAQWERELALREAWLEVHVAYSWDNRDPGAQLEPRPQALALTWLVLARYLPLARNQQPFELPWVRDYFERKAWYTPRDGALYLSFIDKVQMERLEKEIEALEPATLQAWIDGLPQPGMSEAEAQLERRLAERLLAGGTVFEDPQ
jgi:hypothetical protein